MTEALMRVTRLVPWQARAIRNWPIWSLPRWLTIYVLAVIAADLAAIAVAAYATTFSAHNLALFGLLLGCTAGGPVRHRLFRQRARVPGARRLLARPRDDDADPGGLGRQPADGRGAARLLRVPRRGDGAVGRPGGDGLHRRPPDRRHARPQRPAGRRAISSPTTGCSCSPRKWACCRSPRRRSSPSGACSRARCCSSISSRAASSPTTRSRAGCRGANPYRQWLETTQIVLEELNPVEPRASRTDVSLLDRQQAFGYTQEDLSLPDVADGGDRPGGGRLDGHRHADLGALATSRSCSTPISSRTSRRSPTRRSTRSAKSW